MSNSTWTTADVTPLVVLKFTLYRQEWKSECSQMPHSEETHSLHSSSESDPEIEQFIIWEKQKGS